MGSPCVLLNSLALFFVPGQKGVATNEVGECKLSQPNKGEREPPRGAACEEKRAVTHRGDTQICTYFCVFSF